VRAVDPLAVPYEHVLRFEVGKRLARREEAQQRVDSDELLPGREVTANRSKRVRGHEHAPVSPPERHLSPEAAPHDRAKREGRARHALERRHVHGDAETIRKRVGVTTVAVEEDEHGGRVAEVADPFVDAVCVDRIDHVDAPVDGERVRRPPKQVAVDGPAEAEVDLVEEAGRAQANVFFAACSPSTRRSISSRSV
jgi:hypothetical protein